MIDSDRMIRWMLDQAKGATQPPADLTAEERAMWFKLAADRALIIARGGSVEIPFEIPDVSEE